MNKPTDLDPLPKPSLNERGTSAADAAPAVGGQRRAYQRIDAEVLDNSLQGFTLAWLKTLPNAVKPLRCARHYPRVLNRIAALWGLNDRCMELLNELLIDARGTRQGFSYGVTVELRRLKAYRVSLLPRQSQDSDFGPTEPMVL